MKPAPGMSNGTIEAEVQGAQKRETLASMLTGGGVAASLALVACCALPPLLATFGLARAWTLDTQAFLGPHEWMLFWLSLVSLGAGAVAWLSQIRKVCFSDARRGCLTSRVLTPLMLALGACLTWLALHPI